MLKPKFLLPVAVIAMTAGSAFAADLGPGPDQPLLQAACHLKLNSPGLTGAPFYQFALEYDLDPTTVEHVSPVVGQGDGAERYVISVKDVSRGCSGGRVVASKVVNGQVEVRIEFAGPTNQAPLGKPFKMEFTRFNFTATFPYVPGTEVTRTQEGHSFKFTM